MRACAFRCSEHVIGGNITIKCQKKHKILPKGLKGTFLHFQNGQVRYCKSVVPSITFGIGHLFQCRYLPQRGYSVPDPPLG